MRGTIVCTAGQAMWMGIRWRWMMSRFVYVVSFALLLALACALGASAAEPGPASGAALAASGNAMPRPLGNYHIKIRCSRDDTLILETEVATLPGFTADIINTRTRDEGTAFAGMILAGTTQPADLADEAKPLQTSVPKAVLDAAQHYRFAGLMF